MAMELGLAGRTAIVTGGSKGIGRAIGRGLARLPATAAAVDTGHRDPRVVVARSWRGQLHVAFEQPVTFHPQPDAILVVRAEP